VRDRSGGRRRIWGAHSAQAGKFRAASNDRRQSGYRYGKHDGQRTAILSYQPDVHLIDLISQIGQRSAIRAYRAGIEALDSLERTIKTLDDSCDFRKRESLYLASSRNDAQIVRCECATRQQHNFKVELLTREELVKSYSLHAPCAILTRQATEVDPLKLTLVLVRSAQSKGLKVFSHTAVKSYQRNGKESVLTTGDDFRICARHVVFATGYETQQVLKQKAVHLASSYAIASNARTKFPKGRECPVIWESARPYLYVRTTVDGGRRRVVFFFRHSFYLCTLFARISRACLAAAVRLMSLTTRSIGFRLFIPRASLFRLSGLRTRCRDGVRVNFGFEFVDSE
jgi:glycine/D-amino acid oxidase-like deaminating enzyme